MVQDDRSIVRKTQRHADPPDTGRRRDRAGRAAHEVTPSIVLFVSIDDDPATCVRRGTGWMASRYGIPAKAFERHIVSGTAAEVAAVIAAFRNEGAQHVATYVTADQPLEQFERLTAALAAVGVSARG